MKKHNSVILHADSPFAFSEACVRLRTNFIYTTMNGQHKKIVITSCEPGEGKSTVTINLAISLAKIEKKVLLIDCDMRKSVLHHYLFDGEKRGGGLSDVLSNQKKVEECICVVEELGFDLIPSGSTVPNPSELLNSGNMERLLNEVANRYDYILLDTPPVLSVSDAAILSGRADGVVFVVRHERIKKGQVTAAINALKAVGANILGCVLDQYNVRKDHTAYSYGYGGRYYKYKYRYNYYASESERK